MKVASASPRIANHSERGLVRSREPFKFWWAPITYLWNGWSSQVLSTEVDGQCGNRVVTVIGHKFITLTVDICVQHGGREALRRQRRLVKIRPETVSAGFTYWNPSKPEPELAFILFMHFYSNQSHNFHPRNAMLGVIGYGCVCLSVCPSVTHRYCIVTDRRIELFFWHRGYPRLTL